jgi:hypothetical protein
MPTSFESVWEIVDILSEIKISIAVGYFMMKNAFDNTLAIDDLTHMLQLFKQKAYYSQKLLYRYVHEYFDQADTDETKDYLISLFTE